MTGLHTTPKNWEHFTHTHSIRSKLRNGVISILDKIDVKVTCKEVALWCNFPKFLSDFKLIICLPMMEVFEQRIVRDEIAP